MGSIGWDELDKPRYFALSSTLFMAYETMTYPLEFLRTRQQHARTHVSHWEIARVTIRNGGFRGLYRGYTSSLIGSVPSNLMYFGSYEVGKAVLAKIVPGHHDSTTLQFATNLLSGFVADVCCLVVNTPFDVVSQRAVVSPTSSNSSAHPISITKNILRVEGWKGLYRGYGASVLTFAPASALWFASYELCKTKLAPYFVPRSCAGPRQQSPGGNTLALGSSSATSIQKTGASQGTSSLQGKKPPPSSFALVGSDVPGCFESSHVAPNVSTEQSSMVGTKSLFSSTDDTSISPMILPETMLHVVCGSIAGAVSVVVVNPLDVVRTRIQTFDAASASDAKLLQRGIVGIFIWTFKNEGLRALFKGVGPRLFFGVVGSALTFAGYEWAKEMSLDLNAREAREE